jgi:hypothetical protein
VLQHISLPDPSLTVKRPQRPRGGLKSPLREWQRPFRAAREEARFWDIFLLLKSIQ